MRVTSLPVAFTLCALAWSSEAAAQQRPAPWLDTGAAEAVSLPTDSTWEAWRPAPGRLPDYQVPVAADRARLQSWDWHVKRGVAIGALAGLAWGLVERSRGNDGFGLTPVIQTAIGGGVGFYAGTAVYVVRRGPIATR